MCLRSVGVSDAWFEPFAMPYGDTVYELLAEMGLARKEGDEWLVQDESMVAGKWHYPARFDGEFFLATIPLVSAICCSSTNVDRCDPHFHVSYLIKYISGKEEHQHVSVAGTKVSHCMQVVVYKVNEMISDCHLSIYTP